MSMKKDVAIQYETPVTDLKAVVYYSDRSYTETFVFGGKKVFTHFETMTGPYKPKSLTQQKFSDLKSVPENGYLVNATNYGYESGKVLLVSGSPPTE